MQLENIVKTAIFAGVIGVASAFPLFSDDAVTVDKDEETGIEYYYEDGDMVGYRDTDSPGNEDVIWIEDSEGHRNTGGSYYDHDPLLSLIVNRIDSGARTIINRPAFGEDILQVMTEQYTEINSYLERLEKGTSRYNQSVRGLLHLIQAYSVGYGVGPLENEELNPNTAIESITEYTDENIFDNYFSRFMQAYSGAVDILYDEAQENPSSNYQKIIESYETIASKVGEDTFLESLEGNNELHENLTETILRSYIGNEIKKSENQHAENLWNFWNNNYRN